MPSRKYIVLIAEDNPGLARVLSFKFRSCGFDPISCANGDEAWELFNERQIDALVSDHEMPILSGLELIERVRVIDTKLPCFLVTGRQLELSRDPRVITLGIQEVFGKPFSPGTVVSTVAEAIKKHKADSNSPLLPTISTPLTGVPANGLPGAGT